MTEEREKEILENIAALRAREEKRRASRDVRWTSRKEGEEKSHNAVKGTLASIGVGAREGVKSTVANAKAFVQTDLGSEKAARVKAAEKAVAEGVEYEEFMDAMHQKYGAQTWWPIKMTPGEKAMYGSVMAKKKLGLSDKESLAQAQAEQQAKQRAIDAERLVRSIKSKKALQAVDDRYELGKVGEFAQDLGGAFGNMLPSLGVGVVNPVAGLAAFGVQAAAQGYGQAIDEGATHEQAARYGVGTGLLEAGIEKATGGLSRFYGRGVLDKAMRMAPNNSVKNVIFNTAKGAAGEGAEEAVSAIADPYLQRATYNPEAESAAFSDVAYQAAIGAALGGMLGGGSNALGYRAQKRAAERAQTGAQGAQGERVTVDTSAANAGVNGDVGSRRMAENGRDFTGDSSSTQDTTVKTGKIADENSHIDKRDYKTVGSRKMNAFSYDNPEVRPYYVTEAKRMQQELGEVQKPGTYFGQGESGLKDTDNFVGGHGRIASADIVTARDEIGLSYKEIDKALDDIIADNGRENNANAKKLEVLFDQNLSMGTEADGYRIPPNAEYIRTKEGIAGAKDYGYKAEQSRYENGEFDPINDDPYAFEATVYAIAQRRGHELTETEAEEVEALQEVIDADRSAFTEEEIRQMIDEQVSKWKAPRKEAQSPYEQAFDEMLRGEDSTKPKAETEEERRVKDFIQSAAVRARMQVKYVDRPLVQKAYYKDGVIYINKNRPMDEGVKVTVAHELYHAMEGTKEHEAIIDMAIRAQGNNAQKLIVEKIEKYRQSGVELDEEGARAEIGAEFIEKALTDEATINQVLLEDRTLAAKILERIKEIIAVYKAKKSMKAEEAREYAALLKARRLYEDGLEKLHKDEYSPAGVERSARYQIDENLKQQFDDWLSGKMPYNGAFDLGQTPEILKRYGAQDLPLSMTQQVMSKITGMKHSIALDELAKLPDQIANPIMLFRGSVPDSFTVITEITDKSGNDVLAAIHLNKRQGRLYVNNVASVYGKENMINYVQRNIDNQNLLFADTKKAPMWFTTRGLQLPKVVQTNIAANNNIPNSAENVNSQSKNFEERYALDEQTETPEFKRWFGDSKVVDDNGKPKVMYHGSSEKFTSMNKEKGGLLYFTDEKDAAVNYATGGGGARKRMDDKDKYVVDIEDGTAFEYIGNGKWRAIGLADDEMPIFNNINRDKVGYYHEKGEIISNEQVRNAEEFNVLPKDFYVGEYFLDVNNPLDLKNEPKKALKIFEDIKSEIGENDTLNDLIYRLSRDYPVWQATKNEAFTHEWLNDIVPELKKRGYDGLFYRDDGHDTWAVFDSNQVKLVTNEKPTSNDDFRYALDALGDNGGINSERYNELLDRYGRIDEGMEPRVDVAVPKQTNDWDKTRKFVRTAMESENVSSEAKDKIADSLASDIASGKFVYEPVSNQKLQEIANANIAKVGYEKSKAEMFAKYQKNERIKAEDVATLEQLIVKASAEGKADEVMDMIGLASMIGTEMGQSVQALSMLKRMSPEGRLRQMTLLRDRLNSKYELTGESQVEISSRYAEMMLNKNNSSENMDTIQSYIIDDMAKQLPVDMKDKFDAWRYLAMLGNPRTHIRNIMGNILNLSLSRINDQLAGVVEAAAAKKGWVKEGERTKSAGMVSKELKEFAKRDWEEIGKKRTDLSNKYGERGQAERNRKIFTSKLMQPVEKGRKWNENTMDIEDTAFKKVQYIYALSHYMKANNITPEIMQIENSPIAERARQYAEDEAYRVTFQEANALASALNHFENKQTDSKLEKGGQLAVKALMPFKKTPLNILKRGVEYSPAGLINGINDAIKLVRKGDIPATQVINEITQGLTGTGIVALGYFLAEAGLLSAGYDEGNRREQNYENQIGGQNYALTLPGGGTYTLDWAAPTVMPLFVGAALNDEIASRDEGENIGLRDIGSALVKVTDPVLEMSCMDSLQSALESYGNEGAISNMITSAATSYVMQFVPTLSGQFARTIDDTKRSTYAPSDSKYTKTGESLGRQFMNKVPGLSYKSEAAVDVWGRERKQAGGNIVGRAFNNMLSPGTYSSNKETATDKELKRLYEASGESGVLPKMGSKYISYKADGEKSKTYYLTSKEYTKYQTKYGQDNFQAVSELMRSNVYRSMSDEDKAAAVKEIYTYNAQMANKEFFNGRNISYDAGASTTEKLKDAGGWANYFAIKSAFPDSNYDVAKKRKEKCDKYGIDYTAYAESNAKIAELRSANSERYTKASDKTEANKRAIAQYLASRKDLTNPQRQVIWQEYYSGKTSETWISVARRYGF